MPAGGSRGLLGAASRGASVEGPAAWMQKGAGVASRLLCGEQGAAKVLQKERRGGGLLSCLERREGGGDNQGFAPKKSLGLRTLGLRTLRQCLHSNCERKTLIHSFKSCFFQNTREGSFLQATQGYIRKQESTWITEVAESGPVFRWGGKGWIVLQVGAIKMP